MRTLEKNKDGPLRGGTVSVTFHIQNSTLKKRTYVNNGRYKNGTVLLGILGERQRKVQSAVRKTSWGFLVARADARSGVQTRWLRFTPIVNHILPSTQLFL